MEATRRESKFQAEWRQRFLVKKAYNLIEEDKNFHRFCLGHRYPGELT